MLVSIIVPAHNEEKNIRAQTKSLLAMIRKSGLEAEIILVNDNSTDSTGKICEALRRLNKKIRIVHRRSNPGMGNALRDGTNSAKGEIIVWTMADLTDDPETIPRLVEEIIKGSDMVFGSRHMAGGSTGDLATKKKMASRIFSKLSKIFIRTEVDDITNAFRAFRKDVFVAVNPRSGDFAISPELALGASVLGFKLSQIPTVYRSRVQGIANFKMMKMSRRYFLIFLRALLQKYFSRPQP